MGELVDLVVEDARWDAIALDQIAQKCCAATLGFLGYDPINFEISLLACDDPKIEILNADFRNKPNATNVLSWPSSERGGVGASEAPTRVTPDVSGMPLELGDIAIAYDTCAREAVDAALPFDQHTTHLLVHATLHLLGYDHISDQDASLMEDIETKVLAGLGQPDPYGIDYGA